MGRFSAERAVAVVSDLEDDIADLARYGGEVGPAISERGGTDVGFNDPTGNAALKTGPCREWLERWEAAQKELAALANAALRLAPKHGWPMCSLCGRSVIGEKYRRTHNACQQRRLRKARKQ